MDTPEVSDAESKHFAEIGLTADGVCRKGYVPDQIKADEDKRQATYVISTGAVDRDNDTIKVDGWDTKNFLKNPVVLWGHRSDQPAIGKAISVVKSAGVLRAVVQFLPKGISDLADMLWDMVKAGFPPATSVGFRPKKDKWSWNEERGGIDFYEQELLEFSLVSVPSNPQAVLELAKDFAGASAAGVDLTPIRKALDAMDRAKDAVATAPPPTVAAGFAADDVVIHFDGKVVGEAIEKAGRRLSSKTEASLRSAHKSATEAVDHLNDVLGMAEDEMDEMDEEGKAADEVKPELTASEQKAAPQPVLLVAPEPRYLVPLKEAGEVIEAAINRAVSGAIARARGRLD